MQATPTLTDTQTLHTTRDILQAHLPLEASGYRCKSRHLYDALLGVAASGQTLAAVCHDLQGVPRADTLRRYLNKQLTLEQVPRLQERLNEALLAQLPRRLRRKPQQVAIDFHDQPYYGKAPQHRACWVRARAKDGTTRFLRLATAYLIHRGRRLTLAVHFVQPHETTVEVLARLLGRLARLELQVGCLLLDKGFAGISVLQYLEAKGQAALIASPIRGRKGPPPGGTRALCQGRGSYCTTYRFSNHTTSFEAHLAVCRVFTTSRRTGRMQRRGTWLIFIVIGEALQRRTPRQVRRLYQKRFGIETSYRCAGQVRGWTSSPNVAYRFVLLALSFLMVNVWVHLCWLYTQVPRRGGRRLDVARFRLHRYAKFILQALEQRYGRVRMIVAPAPPLP